MGRTGKIPQPDRRVGHSHGVRDPEITSVKDATIDPPKAANPAWPSFVQELWNSLGEGGMAQFYAPADWQMAWLAMEMLSNAFTHTNRTGQINASTLGQAWAILATLGVTEGARRLLSINVEPIDHAAEQETAKILSLYKEAAER